VWRADRRRCMSTGWMLINRRRRTCVSRFRRVLAMAAAAAAGYHLLQLLRCCYLGRVGGVNPCRRSSRALAWICLLLDKVRAPQQLPRTPKGRLWFLLSSLVGIFEVSVGGGKC
jgi:hypothetical protein